jgi:hypothetical protein
VARYRSKDETDLAWNRIRRRITRELDTQIAEWREDALNKLLSEAWTTYVKSLETGATLELEAGYPEFISKALEEAVRVGVEASG